MRRIIIVLLLFILSPLTFLFADEKSDCLNNCENNNRANNMYCPPAGGYTDDDHKQCIEKNAADYNNCIKACSPAPATQPAETAPTATPSPEAPAPPDKPQEETVPTEKQ